LPGELRGEFRDWEAGSASILRLQLRAEVRLLELRILPKSFVGWLGVSMNTLIVSWIKSLANTVGELAAAHDGPA
jgi:hypothetical protein